METFSQSIYEHGVIAPDFYGLQTFNLFQEHLWNVYLIEQGVPIQSYLKITPHGSQVKITVCVYFK